MVTSSLPFSQRPSLVQRLLGRVFSTRKADPAQDALLADLERLADTSPHLMLDLGFRETGTGGHGVTTWRRGPLRVVRHCGAGARHTAFRLSRF